MLRNSGLNNSCPVLLTIEIFREGELGKLAKISKLVLALCNYAIYYEPEYRVCSRK